MMRGGLHLRLAIIRVFAGGHEGRSARQAHVACWGHLGDDCPARGLRHRLCAACSGPDDPREVVHQWDESVRYYRADFGADRYQRPRARTSS